MFGLKKKSVEAVAEIITGTLEPQSPIELKVKACSLAAEARIIRQLEQRQKRLCADGKRRLPVKSEPTFWKLRNHRTREVRQEARATHLARTFLKGQEYSRAEKKAECLPDFKRISELVTRYGAGERKLVAQTFEAWKKAGMNYWCNLPIKDSPPTTS